MKRTCFVKTFSIFREAVKIKNFSENWNNKKIRVFCLWSPILSDLWLKLNLDHLEKYRASAKGALAQGAISSTGTNSPSQVFYGNQFFVHVF